MALPKISDLVIYINKALNGANWNSNWQKLVNWLTDGETDLNVNSIETNSITNNGDLTQNGALSVNGNITSTGTITGSSFVGDGSQLTNLPKETSFSYTPFSVNSAKDSFIDISDTSKLVFLVDDGTLYKPLIITTAKGKTTKITSLLDYNVSGLNGTYYIFADENSNASNVYLKSCTIFRQIDTPTGDNGDIWLDTSNEEYIVREKVSSSWYTNEYNKVPLAKVVITSGVISSLEYLPKNSNGANVVVDGKYSNVFQRPRVVVETYSNGSEWYRIYSDGWCEQGGHSASATQGSEITITYSKTMKDTNYTLTLSAGMGTGSGSTNTVVYSISTTNCVVWTGSPSWYCWKVEGYLE